MTEQEWFTRIEKLLVELINKIAKTNDDTETIIRKIEEQQKTTQ